MDIDVPLKRGPYNGPSEEKLIAACKDILAGKSQIQASIDNGVKLSTLRHRMKSYAVSGSWGKKPTGKRKAKIVFTNIMNRWICDFIDSNSIASHEEIFSNFHQRFGERCGVTGSALKRHIQKSFRVSMRYHRTFPDPAARLENDTINTHHNCLHSKNLINLNIFKSVFVGEVSYDVDSKREYADEGKKALRNTKAAEKGVQIKQQVKKVKPIATKLSFLVAFSAKQVLHYHYEQFEKTEWKDVKTFLRTLMVRMEKEQLLDWSIVMDDVLLDTKQAIQQLAESNRFKWIFLPRCEMNINPVPLMMQNLIQQMSRHRPDYKNGKDRIDARIMAAIEAVPSQTLANCTCCFNCVCSDCDV